MSARKADQGQAADFAELIGIWEGEGVEDSGRFRNSRPLDVHRWADFPELIDLTERLSAELFKGLRGDGPKKRRKHLRVLLTDLLHSYREDPTQYVGYSRNKASYGIPERYNKLYIKHAPLVGAVDALIKSGYVEHQMGFHDRRSGIGRQSRIKASRKLVDLFESSKAFYFAHISKYADEELIVLRNSHKKAIEYDDDDNTRAMRKDLGTYNAFLGRTYIDVVLKGYGQPIKVDLTNKLVRRIFNNSRWDQGGRFYGGWWQNVPRTVRARILIRDRRTQEIDYRGLHAVLAYAIEEIDYFRDIGVDPYTLRNFDSKGEPERYRELVKVCFQACLNATGVKEAIQGIQKEVNFNKQDYPSKFNIREILIKLQEMHKPIENHFYSGVGVKLQWIDSQVAEVVISEMTKAEVAVLCVHDSFICMEGERERLEGLLKTSIQHVLKRNGIKPIQADLKQIGFYMEKPKGFVTDNLGELRQSLDEAQQRRKEIWGEYRIQQPVKHDPNQDAHTPN